MSDDIAASFVDPTANIDESDIEDLPSEPDSDDVTVSEEDFESDAEREWKESLQQLEMLLTMVIVPYAGKYFGRKFAYWGMLEAWEVGVLNADVWQDGRDIWSGNTRLRLS